MSSDETNQARKPGGLTALSLILIAGSALAVRSLGARAQNRPRCVARPEQTEGPYFVDTQLARSDIRSDPARAKPSQACRCK
ncbi:MAG: hypothetical protein IT530_20250 [Burkholderiales bacterium]|nr:hypothetical protein [Burkholderiales bacterium]